MEELVWTENGFHGSVGYQCRATDVSDPPLEQKNSSYDLLTLALSRPVAIAEYSSDAHADVSNVCHYWF
jgi:hypothetical protein